jgi:uncharacterized membrane protein YdjX (TVP38/TMEM64 family)
VNRKRHVVVALIVAGVGAFFWLDLQRVMSLEFFRAQRAQLEQYHQAYPVGSAVVFVAIYIAVTALSLPGAAILTLAGGAVFGLVVGTVLVSFASTAGATLAFLAARFLLRDWVQSRFGPRLESLNDGIEREGPFYLFALRLVPLIPFWLVNLAMGLTTIGTWTFYWVSQVGMLVGTVVYVYAGTQLGQFRVSAGLVGALALLGLLPLMAKKALGAVKRL